MGSIATKAYDNVYYQARLNVASFNDAFKSRERTCDILGIASCTLAEYELGNVKVPTDILVAMATVYHAPQLLNYYCANECTIGTARGMQVVHHRNLEQTAFTLMKASSNIGKAVEDLVEVVADGIITAEEVDTLKSVIALLDMISKLRDELEIKMKGCISDESNKGRYP